jgi:hypothetical protein
MRLFVVTLLCFSLNGPIRAQDVPFSIEGLALRNARLLVAGVAFGFGTYAEELSATGLPGLYCAPNDDVINGNYLWELAKAELDGDHALATVATTVLQRLQMLYPCAP